MHTMHTPSMRSSLTSTLAMTHTGRADIVKQDFDFLRFKARAVVRGNAVTVVRKKKKMRTVSTKNKQLNIQLELD